MRKKFIWILAVIALLGMANCVLVEPAFACKEDVATSSVSDYHGCIVCNSGAHQWISLQSGNLIKAPDFTHAVYFPAVTVSSDPSLGSIFHPPTPF